MSLRSDTLRTEQRSAPSYDVHEFMNWIVCVKRRIILESTATDIDTERERRVGEITIGTGASWLRG
jgi:hypothetical protein